MKNESHRHWLTAVVCVCALTITGCTTTKDLVHQDFKTLEPNVRIAVMPVDVSVSRLHAGGAVRSNETWTLAALDAITSSLDRYEVGNEAELTVLSYQQCIDCPDPSRLIALHSVVINTILQYKLDYDLLPTKYGELDWTLGEDAVSYGASTHYDYALFLSADVVLETALRKVLHTVGLASCAGYQICMFMRRASRVAIASLVDLKTGEVVWLNHVTSPRSDVRTTEGAEQIVRQLLAPLHDRSL